MWCRPTGYGGSLTGDQRGAFGVGARLCGLFLGVGGEAWGVCVVVLEEDEGKREDW